MTDSSSLVPEEHSESTEMFAPYWRLLKRFVLGTERPSFWIRMFVYFAMWTASIFGAWSVLSFLIMKYPSYLKHHKQVDVLAIVELRGRELQLDGELFIQKLALFHIVSIGAWTLVFIASILIWRQKKYASHMMFVGWMTYCVSLFVLLGGRYFVEDITVLDKVFLITLPLFLIAYYSITERQKMDITHDDVYGELPENEGDTSL